jgi:gliding motility-associated-like protein
MKKLLPSLKNLLAKDIRSFLAALFVLVLLTVSGQSQAQVYYVTTAGNIGAADADDALLRVNYDGSSNTTLVGSIAVSPTYSALDLANNRIFVYEAIASSRSIKVLNATTGAVITSFGVLAGINNVNALKYDAVNDYIYYLTTDGSALSTAATDAVVRVKPDGTGQTVIASAFTPSPLYLALDPANNRVFVYESLNSVRGIKTLSLSSGTVTQSAPVNAGTVKEIGYDASTDFLYYLTSDDIALNVAVTDALTKVKPDGTNTTVIKSALTGSPVLFALDAGNNRAFVYEGATANKAIKTVDLSSGDVASVISLSSYVSARVVTSMNVPALPTVTTASAASISSASASLGGTVTRSDASVTARGVVYSSSNASPTIGGSGVTQAANGTGTGAFSASITGLSSSTTYYVKAYATSGAGTVYGAVTTFATLSNDANLSGLSLSAGTLTPSFSSGTITYTASVANANSTITVTPTKNNSNASIKVNNVAVNSGSASGNIGLNVGNNTITTIVTAQDGSTTKTYTVTVTRATNPQSITFNALPAKTYGNADFSPGATASSGLTVSYSSDNTAVATIVSGNIHIVAAGTANITASQAGDVNTSPASNVVQTLSVSKADITATANAQTKVYGDADPAFTYSVTTGALVSGDAFTGALTRTDAGVNIGAYAITQGTLALSTNYNLTFVGADLTITKRPITMKPVTLTKVYGDTEPFRNAFSLTAGSIASGDGTSGQFGRIAGEGVGTYAVTLGGKIVVNIGIGTIVTNNYDITVEPVNFTITSKPITVTANAQTKTYGDADPTLTYDTSTALVSGDAFSGALTRVTGEDFGTYAIGQGTLALNSNYTLSFTGANLTIDKKTVNVTANAQTKTYGDVDPTFTYTADALASGDSFIGSLTRDAGETVGSHAINQGSLALNNNYTLNFTGANLTIGTKTVNVTANTQTKTYGDADPTLTYTADALVSGDSFDGSLTRDAGETVGSHAINQGSLALNSNYTLNFTGANLTIGTKTINVTANAQTKTYGDADPTLTYTADALASGDGFDGSLTRDAGETVGSHTINQGSLALNSNYILNFTGSDLTIIARPITIAADVLHKTYGDTDPDFTYHITAGSLLSGDAITGSLVRDAGETTGVHATNLGTIAINNPNYTVTFQPSYLEIDRAPLTITADNKTKVAGQANPALTYVITGFKNSEDESVFSTPVNISTLADNSSPAADYPIIVNNATSINYDFSFVNGILTVNPASTNANLANLTVNEGAISPVFDASTLDYTMLVSNSQGSITITPTVVDATATLTVNYMNATSGTSVAVPVYPGENPIPITVTAQDGTTTKNYTLTVSRAYETISTLSALTVSEGTLSPAFTTGGHSYTVSVPNTVESIALSPVTTSMYGFIKINGSPVETGSTPLRSLNVGENTFNIEVFAQDRSISETYVVKVTRAASNNANLAFITISPNSILAIQQNTPALVEYTTSVGLGTTSITLTPTLKEDNATMTINGTAALSGVASAPIALNVGVTMVNIIVTAQNGVTTKTYRVAVNRTGSNIAGLSFLSITPGSILVVQQNTPTLVEYTTSVSPATTSITLTPTLKEANGTITINGSPASSGVASNPVSLNAGPTTINLVATAEDGVTARAYKVTVNRAGSTIAGLSSIIISPSSILTIQQNTPTLVEYTTSVGTGTTSITLTPTLKEANGTITINGSPASSGVASAPISLGVGTTMIEVVVTAEDNVTTKTYKIGVSRAGSSLAGLSYISVSPSSVLTIQQSTYNLVEYTTSVSNATASIRLTPTLKGANGSITVNGSPVLSGVTSDPIPLNVGVTNINVVATAEDGITTKTYTIAVTRAGSNIASLTHISISPGSVLAIQQNTSTQVTYTTTVSPGTASIKLTPTLKEANATMTINGTPALSGVISNPIPLNVGTTTINIVVTAQNGVTTRTYSITFTRPATFMIDRADSKLLFANKVVNPMDPTDNDGVVVHQGVSPNGDGSNDFLSIEGISAYSGNKLSIMNANGALVFETKDYGKNSSNLFDGHSNKNGALLKPGTYFYSLEYKAGKEKRKTGYIILKY